MSSDAHLDHCYRPIPDVWNQVPIVQALNLEQLQGFGQSPATRLLVPSFSSQKYKKENSAPVSHSLRCGLQETLKLGQVYLSWIYWWWATSPSKKGKMKTPLLRAPLRKIFICRRNSCASASRMRRMLCMFFTILWRKHKISLSTKLRVSLTSAKVYVRTLRKV